MTVSVGLQKKLSQLLEKTRNINFENNVFYKYQDWKTTCISLFLNHIYSVFLPSLGTSIHLLMSSSWLPSTFTGLLSSTLWLCSRRGYHMHGPVALFRRPYLEFQIYRIRIWVSTKPNSVGSWGSNSPS
jgi:hypothetical protein